ncbi:hypothetical protein AB0346_00800 [Nocardia beijingensis]|uniref:hypothetical protein n=1 Tax=Nocardia beijingensis TaxID=95162 RepID=UPI00344FCFE9
MTTEKTVPTIETDKQIIVARTLRWRQYRSNEDRVQQLFDAVGLRDYMPSRELPFTVDLSMLLDRLPQQAEIKLYARDGIPNRYDVGAAVERQLNSAVQDYVRLVYDGDIVAESVERESRAIDVDAVLAEWGGIDTPYPKAGSAEVDTARRELVRSILKVGVEQLGYCPELETSIRAIGLSEYLPPETAEVTVDIPGWGPSTITAPLTRIGEFDKSRYRDAVLDFIATKLGEQNLLTPPTTAA